MSVIQEVFARMRDAAREVRRTATLAGAAMLALELAAEAGR